MWAESNGVAGVARVTAGTLSIIAADVRAARRSLDIVLCLQPELVVFKRRSTSNQQNDQYDQKNGAEPATDVRTSVVEAAATEQDHQNDDQEYEVHEVSPCGNNFAVNGR
jgi:hypothetical protein